MTYPSVVATSGGASAVSAFSAPAGGQVGDYVIACIDVLNTSITAVAPTSSAWVVIGAGTTIGTLRTYAFAAPWSAGLDYTFVPTPGAATAMRSSILIRGAGVIANWVLGPITARATLGTSTTTVAPSLTATANETLVVGLFGERTTAIETAVTSVTNATHVAFYVEPSGIIESSEIVSKTLALTGDSTGLITVTYPNVQATNGLCQLIGIPSATAAPVAIHGPSYEMGSGANREITYWTGTQELIAGFGTPGYANVAAMLATPQFSIAHRGGSLSWPESSLRAYTNAVFWSVGALEASVWMTSDGVWVCNHDQTTAAVFGTNYDITTTTWATLSALRSTVGNEPMLRLSELLTAYAKSHVIFIDNKANTNVSTILDILDAAGGPTRFVVKGFYTGVTQAGLARARGYQTWGYGYAADATALSTSSADWTILGMNYDASSAAWILAKTQGKPVIAHILPNLAARTTAISQGAAGFMVSNVKDVIPRTIPAAITLL